MQIQLTKISEHPEIIKNLYSFAKDAKIGTWNEDKVMLKLEEYIFILHQLSFDQKAPEEAQMQWSYQFQNCVNVIASKYQSIYLYP